MKLSIFLALLLTAAIAPHAWAQSPSDKESLRGIRSIDVVVEELEDYLEVAGVNKQQIMLK